MRTNWIFLGWYYHGDGELVGPSPREEIARLVRRGWLRPSAEVLMAWKDANNQIRFFRNTADSCLAPTGAGKQETYSYSPHPPLP